MIRINADALREIAQIARATETHARTIAQAYIAAGENGLATPWSIHAANWESIGDICNTLARVQDDTDVRPSAVAAMAGEILSGGK